MTNIYAEELKEILTEDWYALSEVGNRVKSEHDGEFKVVAEEKGDSGRWTQWYHVVVKAPDETYWEYDYENGLTEYQEGSYPGEYGDVEIRQVKPVEKTVVVTEWKEIK